MVIMSIVAVDYFITRTGPRLGLGLVPLFLFQDFLSIKSALIRLENNSVAKPMKLRET